MFAPSLPRRPLVLVLGLHLIQGCALPVHDWERPEQPVPTPAGLVDASDPQPISEIAARYGQTYWERDGFREPRIRAEAGGVAYVIEFYGCAEGRACTDLRLAARLAPDDEGAPLLDAKARARWNRENRFGKLTLDEDEHLVLEMNLALAGGVTRQNLDLSLDWWIVALRGLVEQVDLPVRTAAGGPAKPAGKYAKIGLDRWGRHE